MGNKRKRSKQKAGTGSSAYRGKVWPDHTIDELLSYLNSQIMFLDPATESKIKRDFEDVDQELARRLNHLREDGVYSFEQLHDYSPSQIRAKLRRLYATCRKTWDDDNEWTIIYTQGFACLDWTGDNDRQARMARRSNEIKHKWKWDFLHSPRKTRADGQINGSTLTSPRREIRASSSISNLRSSVGRSRVAGSQPPSVSRATGDIHHVSDTDSFATEGDNNTFIKIENVAHQPYVQSTSEHDEIQVMKSSLQDSRELSDSEHEAFGTPLRSFSPTNSKNTPSNDNLEQSPSVSRLSARLRAAEKDLSKVKQDAELEIDFWKAKYCTAQDYRLRFKRSMNALIAKQNALRESKLSAEEDLVRCQALIDDLLVKQDSRERVQDLKSSAARGPDDETISKVSKSMQDIGDRLRESLKDAKFTAIPELRTLSQGHLLSSLFEQAFGIEWNSSEAMELLEHCNESSWWHQHGLFALCGAALVRWVFQQTQADILFDRYQNVGTRSSTNRYREAIQLFEQSDPALARTVDSIVHRSLTEEDNFEHFQKAKARDLAYKLQEALVPLCQLDPYNDEQSDAGSEDDGYAIVLLTDVFFSAIEVQCRLVLAGGRYECAWYQPGAPFDKTSMSHDRAQKGSALDVSTVRLTLLPGINQIIASRFCVEFGGFAERRHRDHEKAVCLVRAVVLRGSADLH